MRFEELEPHYRMTAPSRMPEIRRNPVHVVLDNIRSAFNVGSIFRTADAGAVEHLYLCGMTAYPPNLKLAKTALGAFDYVPWTHYPRPLDAVERLQAARIPIVAVEVTPDAVPLARFDWTRPVALVFGNEVRGIGADVLAECDATVRIPMRGFKNSINVATAFGVALYHILHTWDAL